MSKYKVVKNPDGGWNVKKDKRCDHLKNICFCCGNNECALFGESHKHPTNNKEITAWAVALESDNNFIPDFNVDGYAENILQIHSDKESAQKLADKLKNGWKVVELKIIVNPK